MAPCLGSGLCIFLQPLPWGSVGGQAGAGHCGLRLHLGDFGAGSSRVWPCPCEGPCGSVPAPSFASAETYIIQRMGCWQPAWGYFRLHRAEPALLAGLGSVSRDELFPGMDESLFSRDELFPCPLPSSRTCPGWAGQALTPVGAGDSRQQQQQQPRTLGAREAEQPHPA